jgi:hypothetical protein
MIVVISELAMLVNSQGIDIFCDVIFYYQVLKALMAPSIPNTTKVSPKAP